MSIETIPALTILQPWASAIALGVKRIETRSWRTDYRGPLLIHAGKGEQGCKQWLLGIRDLLGGLSWHDLPFGAIIAVADLVDCFPSDCFKDYGGTEYIKGLGVYQVPACELALGDYSPGRYGWLLANVRALPQPIPYKGKQGLWRVPLADLPQEARTAA